jgi:hypothetical protein
MMRPAIAKPNPGGEKKQGVSESTAGGQKLIFIDVVQMGVDHKNNSQGFY